LFQQGLSSPEPVPLPKEHGLTGPYQGSFVAPSADELAAYFPQLEILELLGQGGMGAVYKARQVKLDRLVALKILPSAASRDPAFAERFMREARALARLTHPNIVAIHEFGEAGNLFYFVMEYVDGVNLRQVFQSGRLQPSEALRLVPQICDALQFAHDEGIVHRDIKPENILLDKKGRVKIADFGLAKLLGAAPASFLLTGSRQIMGTPHYMAPEQMERPQAVDSRADIYSLGVVFYEMLTGELPLGRFALPSEKAPVDGRIDDIVLRALEKEPERRYQRVSEVRTDMEALGAPAVSPPPAPLTPVPNFQEEVDEELLRQRVMAPAVGLMLTSILALVSWALTCVLFLYNEWEHIKFHRMMGNYFVRDDLTGYLVATAIAAPAILLASWFLYAGGRRMMRLESYGFALAASIWAMIPWSYAFLIGVPLGIWAFRVLRHPEVKLAFARRAVRTRLTPPPLTPRPAPITPRPAGKLRSLFQSIHSLFFTSRVSGSDLVSSIPAIQARNSILGRASFESVAASSSRRAASAARPTTFWARPYVWMGLFVLLALLAMIPVTFEGKLEENPSEDIRHEPHPVGSIHSAPMKARPDTRPLFRSEQQGVLKKQLESKGPVRQGP
jgi:tRNA A-37 threonylcarbamoyl transferase component Bud32